MYLKSPVIFYEESPILHLLFIPRGGIYRWPYGNHYLNPIFFQFLHHAHGIRPILRFKTEFALLRPMKKINNQNIQGYITFFIIICDLQNLLLVFVTQLRLP